MVNDGIWVCLMLLKIVDLPMKNGDLPMKNGDLPEDIYGYMGYLDMGVCVWKCCVPLNPMVLLIMKSRFEMAISLGIYPIFRQTHLLFAHELPSLKK